MYANVLETFVYYPLVEQRIERINMGLNSGMEKRESCMVCGSVSKEVMSSGRLEFDIPFSARLGRPGHRGSGRHCGSCDRIL